MIQFLKDKLIGVIANDVKVIRDPMGNLQRKVIFVLVFIVSIFTSFYAGEYWTSEVAHERDALLEKSESLLKQLEQEKINLAAALVNVETSNIAVEQVRESNNELISQIADLERDLIYYQRVMNPIHNDKGLRIDTVELEKTTNINRFRLNVVLTQLSKKNKTVIKGLLHVNIEGSELGAKKLYKLEKLKIANKDLSPKFRFRYYQEISEEFVLPKDFIPERVKLLARSSGSKSMKVERIIDWPFQLASISP